MQENISAHKVNKMDVEVLALPDVPFAISQVFHLTLQSNSATLSLNHNQEYRKSSQTINGSRTSWLSNRDTNRLQWKCRLASFHPVSLLSSARTITIHIHRFTLRNSITVVPERDGKCDCDGKYVKQYGLESVLLGLHES